MEKKTHESKKSENHSNMTLDSLYGRFHPGRELTAIELDNFWFSLKPINMWILDKFNK